MSERIEEESISRRRFLKAALATAALATAAGTGAALLVNQDQPVVITSAPPSLPPVTHNLASVNNDSAELLSRLAASQAENVRLRAALDAAERRLATTQQSDGSGALTETLQIQLGEANTRISALAGLIALYDQLDQIDMAGVVNGGLGAVSGVVTGLMEKASNVAQGVVAGREALTEFEAHIPVMENGRIWLTVHLNRIAAYYQAVENALKNIAEKAGSFLQMLNEWFQDVLKWLPFGAGRKAAEIMDTLSTLLAETPNTISGLRTNIVQPLDAWLAGGGEEMPLRRNLIKPLRERMIQPASEVLAQAEAVRNTYQAQLVHPVQSVVESQDAVRNIIAEYRERHQV